VVLFLHYNDYIVNIYTIGLGTNFYNLLHKYINNKNKSNHSKCTNYINYS